VWRVAIRIVPVVVVIALVPVMVVIAAIAIVSVMLAVLVLRAAAALTVALAAAATALFPVAALLGRKGIAHRFGCFTQSLDRASQLAHHSPCSFSYQDSDRDVRTIPAPGAGIGQKRSTTERRPQLYSSRDVALRPQQFA
jgi:hypothetical protein